MLLLVFSVSEIPSAFIFSVEFALLLLPLPRKLRNFLGNMSNKLHGVAFQNLRSYWHENLSYHTESWFLS
jgi:hypothetical protein